LYKNIFAAAGNCSRKRKGRKKEDGRGYTDAEGWCQQGFFFRRISKVPYGDEPAPFLQRFQHAAHLSAETGCFLYCRVQDLSEEVQPARQNGREGDTDL